jgi:hypothetical protein
MVITAKTERRDLVAKIDESDGENSQEFAVQYDASQALRAARAG